MKQQGNAEKAGKEDVNGALQNLQAREPDGIYSDPVRPYSTFPRPAASAWHCTPSGSLVALPFTLMVFFFPMAG